MSIVRKHKTRRYIAIRNIKAYTNSATFDISFPELLRVGRSRVMITNNEIYKLGYDFDEDISDFTVISSSGHTHKY